MGDLTRVWVDGDIMYAADINMMQGGIYGWLPVDATWTYNAADSFTVPTGATSLYQAGDKVRWKDGAAFKYGNLLTVADALLTIVTNTDYVIANNPITDISISRAEFPIGWPDWFNYAPTLTGFSADPASGIYRYKINGRAVSVAVRQPNPGTSNDTVFTISAPVVAATITGMAWSTMIGPITDNSAVMTTPGRIRIQSAGTSFSLFTNASTGAWTNSGTKVASSGLIVYEM